MTPIQKRQLDILTDTCTHFNIGNRGVIKSGPRKGCCSYVEGCAIGRLIPADIRVECDALPTSEQKADCEAFDLFPQAIQELGREFLGDLQYLHDCNDNWDAHGLSEEGQRERDRIIHRFHLA